MTLSLQKSEHFELLRKYLGAVAFNEQALCGRLGIQGLNEILSGTRARAAFQDASDELGVLARLFLLGESLKIGEIKSVLPPSLVEALTVLGLLIDDAGDVHLRCSSVALYPVGHLFIVSDRCCRLDDQDFPDDFVFPAITANTSQFLATLPLSPCGNFLELCSGAGAAAMGASRYARHAWAIDITERSTAMAEFNRLLNGVDNVTVVKGDLYEQVREIQFDRIVAHPPYMPVLHPAQVFYGGGVDGEEVTRRIVEALPRHLRPGGGFYCLAQGSDRKDAPFEQRVRNWLGENRADFDVAIVVRQLQAPHDTAMQYAVKLRGGSGAASQMHESLAQLGVESMVYGWIIIQRRDNDRQVFTVRRSAGPKTGRHEVEWLLRWETFAADFSAHARLPEMSPRTVPSLELHTVYRMKEGELVPEQFTLHAERPFSMDCRVQPWVAFLLPQCDGKSTCKQLYEFCLANNLIRPDTPLEGFFKLLMLLISGGFLEVDDLKLPNHGT